MLLRSLPLFRTSARGASGRKSWLSSLQNGLGDSSPPEHLERLENPDNKPLLEHKATQGAAAHKKDMFKVIRRRVPKPHLTPYELSQRTQALCQGGQLDKAVTLVKEAPWDPKNAIAWGGLVHGYLWAGKYKEAYRLFTDMKRRGFTPTTRTYGTMLGGYTRIQDWSRYPTQLENVCSLYDQLKRHHESIKKRIGLHSTELSNIPYTSLIRIFGKAQQFQRMYDVFNSLPSEGPLAPDAHTFTALLEAIGHRSLSVLPPSLLGSSEEEQTPLTFNELKSKNASDARLIWRQLLRASTKSPGFDIDSHTICAMLKILAWGRPSDQTFAFEIAYDYLGLSRPGQQAIPAKLDMHPLTLEALLHVCNNASRYSLTLHYVQQIIDSDSGEGKGFERLGLRRILNTRHMDLVLEAHAALAAIGASGESEQALETLLWMLRMQATAPAPGKEGGIGPQIRPATSTFDLVLLTCWRTVDWGSACRTFELMTGYEAVQFCGDMQSTPIAARRSAGRALIPSAGFMSSLIRTASRTHQAKHMRQALNIFEHYGWNTFFHRPSTPDNLTAIASRKQEKDWIFYTFKLAQALADALPALLKLPYFSKPTTDRWEALYDRAINKATSPRLATDHPSGDAEFSRAPMDDLDSMNTDMSRDLSNIPDQQSITADQDIAQYAEDSMDAGLAPYPLKGADKRTNDK